MTLEIESAKVRFLWPVRVYWEDTDAGGVVYHASYLRFFERARTEWLRAQGIEQSLLRSEGNVIFVLSRIEVQYLRPARLDDLLEVRLALRELKRASFVVEQQIVRGSDTTLICTGLARIACLHEQSFRPQSMPAHIHALIGT